MIAFRIEAAEDALKAFGLLPVPASITLTLVEEISVTEFYRALHRFEMMTSRVRDMCAKRLFCDYLRYEDYRGYKVSDRLASQDWMVTSEAPEARGRPLLIL